MNRSLSSRSLPNVFKHLKKTNLSNHCLPVTTDRYPNFWTAMSFLMTFQLGFRLRHSIGTALLRVSNDWFKENVAMCSNIDQKNCGCNIETHRRIVDSEDSQLYKWPPNELYLARLPNSHQRLQTSDYFLQLHPDKTEVLIIGPQSTADNIQQCIGPLAANIKKPSENLDVLFVHHMNFELHVKKVGQSQNMFLSPPALTIVIHCSPP